MWRASWLRKYARLVGAVPSRAVLLATLLAHGARAQARTHVPSIDDMPKLLTIDELVVSPDGHWAAYATSTRFGVDTGEPHHITILDIARNRTWRLAVRGRPHGLQWSSGPRSEIAFLAADGGRDRLWRSSPLDSGSVPRQITISDSLGGEILSFAWGPDGASMAYLATEDQSVSRMADARQPTPRLVIFRDSAGDYTGPTSPLYSRDSAGAYVAVRKVGDARSRVLARHLVSAKGSPGISWSHTGKLLVNGAPIRVDWQSRITCGLAYTIDPSSGIIRQVGPGSLSRKRAAWSPSGEYIADLRFEFLPHGRLPLSRYTLEVENQARSRASITFDGESDGLAYNFPPMWGWDDRTIYIAKYRHATARLFEVDRPSGRWRALTPDTLSISRYAISTDGRVLLGVLENANQPQEIFRIDPVTGSLVRLTHIADHLPPMRLGKVERVAWRSRDERFTIHGFLVTPASYDTTRRYPLIVLVHGGPGHFYTESFIGINFGPPHLPPQLLAAAGYMVLLPNPRGDASYGEEFRDALHANWAPGPFGDVEAGVDALIARGLVDSRRVAIAGASYGGYLAAYAITQSNRFAAASIDDAPVDLTSEYGQNYATRSSWAKAAFDGTPWTKPQMYASQSPITYVGRVRTPVIMRYGGRSTTHDAIRQSYMLAQGFELYAGLRDTGVPVEFVLHPDQGHGITDWSLYRDWVARNVAWFNYWLLRRGSNPLLATP